MRKVEGIYAANFLYDPFGRLRAGGVRAVYETSGSWNPCERYTITGDSYYDRLISMRDWPNGAQFRYHLDALGSVGFVTYGYEIYGSECGANCIWYEAFGPSTRLRAGNIVAESTGWPGWDRYKYVGSLGYCQDYGNGFYHVGARYYNPLVGRFTTRDPLNDSTQQYAYAGNRPVVGVDPGGLSAQRFSGGNPCWMRNAAVSCLDRLNLSAEWGIAGAPFVNVICNTPLPSALAGWTNPWSGTIYIDPEFATPAGFCSFVSTLAHETWHYLDRFNPWRVNKRGTEDAISRQCDVKCRDLVPCPRGGGGGGAE